MQGAVDLTILSLQHAFPELHHGQDQQVQRMPHARALQFMQSLSFLSRSCFQSGRRLLIVGTMCCGPSTALTHLCWHCPEQAPTASWVGVWCSRPWRVTAGTCR